MTFVNDKKQFEISIQGDRNHVLVTHSPVPQAFKKMIIAPQKKSFLTKISQSQKCCFYLDIDVKDLNLNDDHRKLSPELLAPNMKQKLHDFFSDLDLDITNENVLILESSNEFKTSFHVVIRGAWITENAAVWNPIYCLFIQWLHEHKKEGESDVTRFLDASVYSSLQNFGTIHSTKWRPGNDQRYWMRYLCNAPDILY
ncbi:hypothetical protein BDK51DRAFT_26513 [Blyttiomyces helicus]|uniref:Uncharacterized protein n=1 Tax=Blyttiomyces helicus TaxID=388810 RepID=A0A4P9WLY4_9FUNG|nr:hypothetical protein BDK51DRAFT_26513 [Blyttiomyces helicus]|eukprot:RKO92160.1 hypothetical protein BDK51DRAFT_26513 [Blyttiomyces helicus]